VASSVSVATVANYDSRDSCEGSLSGLKVLKKGDGMLIAAKRSRMIILNSRHRMFARPARHWLHQFALIPASWIGIGCSLLLAVYVAHWERAALHNELRELATDRAQVLYSSMRSSTEVLYSLASLHAATGDIRLEHFVPFARDAIQRHPELQAVEWIPRVPYAEREGYEQRRRAEGYADFSFTEIGEDGLLTRAAYRAEYFPVYFVEPFASNTAAHGFDVSANSQRVAALEQARDTGLPAVTAPIRLAQETAAQQGFLMFYPIYSIPAPQTVAERRASLQGFALAVFRAGDLVASALRDIAERGITVSIFDTGDPLRPLSRQEARQDNRQTGNSSVGSSTSSPMSSSNGWLGLTPWLDKPLQWEMEINVAGRQWRLLFEPTQHFAAQRRPNQSIAALAVGLTLTFLLVAYLASAARREQEIHAANAALQREIDERERAVEAAQAANRAKSDFLANMSHEIRTPLNAVLGYAQLLRRDARLDISQRESVSAIIVSGNHLLSQINAVLDFSKIETGRMELQPTDLHINNLLRELDLMFRPRCQDKGLKLRVQPLLCDGDQNLLGAVYTDGCKLRQILINLLGNAVRFTHKGEVLLGTCITGDGRFRFDVIDTGPGIPANALVRIFEPFYQNQSHDNGHAQIGGTGLGLAIARRQARLLGGEIDVASEEGEGSRFTLILPIPPARKPEIQNPPVAIRWHLPERQKLRVLIVDDITANRDILHRLLADAGCETAQARNHATTLAQISAMHFDAIFLDIRMPDGNGLELVQQLRIIQPQVPVIAYTALAFEQDRAQFLAAGCDDFLAKPVAAEILFNILEKLLGLSFTREWEESAAQMATADYSRVMLPANLHQRLLTAAELHSTTALKICIEELLALDEGARAVAEKIRQHMRAYDMKAIGLLLLQVQLRSDEQSNEELHHVVA
jgi:signal transduction histidine kinase/CheY-like chemotaxis protein